MKPLIIISTVLTVLFACNPGESTDDESIILDQQTEVLTLADSLIPELVNNLVEKLEANDIKTVNISSSKWNLFGVQGVWLKTDKGILNVVPIPDHIDRTKITITEIESDTPGFHSFELHYNGILEKKMQGKQTYYTVGKHLIYKTFEKSLYNQIEKIEDGKEMDNGSN